MAEWSKAHAWKVCRRGTVSRVRIPFSPPAFPRAFQVVTLKTSSGFPEVGAHAGARADAKRPRDGIPQTCRLATCHAEPLQRSSPTETGSRERLSEAAQRSTCRIVITPDRLLAGVVFLPAIADLQAAGELFGLDAADTPDPDLRGISRVAAGDRLSVRPPEHFVHLFDAAGQTIGALEDWRTTSIT